MTKEEDQPALAARLSNDSTSWVHQGSNRYRIGWKIKMHIRSCQTILAIDRLAFLPITFTGPDKG
jgi:hypothetical protein